jgi:AraC family transcriptional activator of pobA
MPSYSNPLILEDLQRTGVTVLRINNKQLQNLIYESLSMVDSQTDVYCLCLMLEGNVHFEENREGVNLKRNSVFLASPDTPRNGSISIDDQVDMLLVPFTSSFPVQLHFPENFMEVIENYFTSKFNPIWHIGEEESARLEHIILTLQGYLRLPNDYLFKTEILKSLFQVFLLELGRLATQYAGQSLSKPSRKKQLYLDFYMMVKEHYKARRTVNYYADQLAVTPKYLSEVTKELSGMSASELINNFVIQEAKSLLNYTRMSIADIAEALNFSDQSFFGKFFKRSVGMSPHRYRSNVAS